MEVKSNAYKPLKYTFAQQAPLNLHPQVKRILQIKRSQLKAKNQYQLR